MKLKLLILPIVTLLLALPIAAQPSQHVEIRHLSRAAQRAAADLDRLEALLINVRSRANINPQSWRTVTGEAAVLANRIGTNTRLAYPSRRSGADARATAAQISTHTNEMRRAARGGDGEAVRNQAEEALRASFHLEEIIKGR